MEVSKHQLEFLLETFFKNEKYNGWKNIATKLIKDGECVVAGEECIWIGGVGNFIETSSLENAYKCSLYTFDILKFLESEFFKEYSNAAITAAQKELREAKQKYEDLINL